MDVAISGATGLIGRALRHRLIADGHRPFSIVRRPVDDGEDAIAWDPDAGTIEADKLEGLDGVVHLAGAGIGDERWTDDRKRLILESRTKGTDLLARTLAGLDRRPPVLVSGSAIGYYGERGDEVLTESSPPGDDFLASICVPWEAATSPAADAGIRVATIRTGIVLSTDGGALPKMLPLFKLGLGGPYGSGSQWWSWISIDDQVGAILHLLTHEVSGPVNLTAGALRQKDFAKALGRALHRPSLLPVPPFGPGLVVGRELAHALLFTSERVEATVLGENAYEWIHPDLDTALAAVLAG